MTTLDLKGKKLVYNFKCLFYGDTRENKNVELMPNTLANLLH